MFCQWVITRFPWFVLQFMFKTDSPPQMLGFIDAEEEETRKQKGKDVYRSYIRPIHYKVSNNYVKTGTL